MTCPLFVYCFLADLGYTPRVFALSETGQDLGVQRQKKSSGVSDPFVFMDGKFGSGLLLLGYVNAITVVLFG